MIEYRHNFPLDPRQVIQVFQASGIRRPTEDLPRIARMFANADLVLSAWDNGQLIAVCRALTDYSYCCYLSDLAVDSRYQHQGIGSQLLKQLKEILGEEVTLVLLAANDAMSYYPKIGMTHADNAFVIKRSEL